MNEIDPLVLSYSHLANFPREKDALHTLKKVASLVKPLMRARGWKIGQLIEFYPEEHNLLGLNVDSGRRICLRLRYANDRNQFLPIEQVVDTMLHELAHNAHGPHNARFHALWNQLRDEHEALVMKGYSGEGFLSAGHRLGGRRIPPEEARRLARVAAENRRTVNAGSGQKLGGFGPRPGQDIRRVIIDAIERRNNTLQGCANDNQTQDEIRRISDTATRNGFRTQAEEDAANDTAIAQALWELVDEEERAQKGDNYISPSSSRQTWTNGGASEAPRVPPREASRNVDRGTGGLTWTCDICTLENQASFLCCDACGTERDEKITQSLAQRWTNQQRTVIDLTESPPPRNRNTQTHPFRPGSSSRPTTRPAMPPYQSAIPAKPANWTCSFCGRVRERQWWSCDMCGEIKRTS
ncbi:WLM-domain-containing protein [Daldinia decipiens]|uniref:WLM-domain-containing protein n=1 Tax=Daldinia decipiens TaxID=326647 RepID=UPI0020C502E4|nr:WLM-domain-containing protein [Daldinia decipiens]KAI1655310.1 WLM-domain-containing protein [Daldinia decipiens]